MKKRWLAILLLVAILTGIGIPEIGAQVAIAETATAKVNAPQVLSVSKTATKSVDVGGTYQIKAPGETIKSCVSGNTKVAKVTKAGLVTVKKAGTAKITITLKNKRKFVLTLKAAQSAKELSGYFQKGFSATRKKFSGLRKKTGRIDQLKYDDYTDGKLRLITYHFSWRKKDLVDDIYIKGTKAYSLFGVTVGMKVEDARKKLKRFENSEFYIYNNKTLCYVTKMDYESGLAISSLDVGYKNGKVTWINYGIELD